MFENRAHIIKNNTSVNKTVNVIWFYIGIIKKTDNS